tara:strand:- start:5612 stop:6193 length:582 start_codon:yes stop_codon:yes gene_type:complete
MKQEVDIKKVKPNPKNPRVIKDHKFNELVTSIIKFPKMMEKRTIVVDENMVVLGGNMRLRAAFDAGLKKVWIDDTEGWTEEEKQEFIIKDNVSFGQWDFEALANDWEGTDLSSWGVDIWQDNQSEFFSFESEDDEGSKNELSSDNDYSKFELVMLHSNKIEFLNILNKVKSEFAFEKHEEALMQIIKQYKNEK